MHDEHNDEDGHPSSGGAAVAIAIAVMLAAIAFGGYL